MSLAADSLGFLFAGPKSDVLVTWLPPNKSREIALASPATMIDPASGAQRNAKALTLSSAARLIATAEGSQLSAEWRKRASREHAPWELTPNAKEVGLTAGAHTQAVCLVSARSLETHEATQELNLVRTRGAWFAVDPKFIGYASAPLEITLVARGHGRQASGFNLKYESRRPIQAANGNGMVVKGSWNTVRGTAPVTFTWHIDDASFVSKYGPNLGVDCDGPEHCDFSILSLNIRKR